jgi:acetyl/propionyl-CoA carboxylase alpha subunit
LICWGDTRGEAILRMKRALNELRIMGVKTNVPFHQQLFRSTRFQAGQFDTRFIEDRFEMEEQSLSHSDVAAIAATLIAHKQGREAAEHIERATPGQNSNWKWGARRF